LRVVQHQAQPKAKPRSADRYYNGTSKPPSNWRLGEPRPIVPENPGERRSRSIEYGLGKILMHDKGDRRFVKQSSLTAKPNEVAPNLHQSDGFTPKITKHYLDDTEIKQALQEEGVCFFPGQDTRSPREVMKSRQKKEKLTAYQDAFPAPKPIRQPFASASKTGGSMMQGNEPSQSYQRPPHL